MQNTQQTTGLEGIIAFDTELCDIDGAAGGLWVRGEPIADLASMGFERAAALLWLGTGTAEAGERVRRALAAARSSAHERLGVLAPLLDRADPMEGVRAALAAMPSPEGDFFDQACALTGALGILVAAWGRRSAGLTPLVPDPDACHAHDIHRLLVGSETPAAPGLEAYLTTVVEHGVNASTFAARTVASTAADLTSCVIAGMCALKGPLHGGAPGPVLDMLDAIGREPRARSFLEDELRAGRRIMGMGHRVYRARDPRALVLEHACRRLASDNPRITLARAVEREAERLLAAAHPDRPLRANVEFFTAVLLEALDVPRSLFTAMFAAARVVGWCAHADEQRRTGRLIRPRARYIGPRAA